MTRLAAPPESTRWWPEAGGGKPLRQRVAEADAALSDAFRAGEPVEGLVAARAWVVEQAVLEAWALEAARRDDLALLAVGGFGRGELFPRSDVDLLVLAGGPLGADAAAPIERFFARLWDEGLNVGHAVRTPAECGEGAAADVTILTNLLDARLLAGRGDLAEAMRVAIAPGRVWPGQTTRARRAP